MSRGYNTSRGKSKRRFSQTFMYQDKKVPFVRGGRRVY